MGNSQKISSAPIDRSVKHELEKGKMFCSMNIGKNSYMIEFNIYSRTLTNIEIGCQSIHIGRYTSIARGCSIIIDMNHDYNSLYQGLVPELSLLNKNINYLGQITKRIDRKGQLIIGNDVWIGMDVTIHGGVRIGDGAVVASGSNIVTDVPPYAIVGGNPAKIIRYRFSQEIIEKLRRIEWWNWSSSIIENRKEDMVGEVLDFSLKYDKNNKKYKIKSREFIHRLKEQGGPLITYFMDFSDDYPVYTNVINSFLDNYREEKAELLLCYNPQNNRDKEKMCTIMKIIEQYKNILNVLIQYVEINNEDDEEKIISESDILITNRDIKTLNRISYADKYHVNILSGVDIPVFINKKYNSLFFI